MARVNDEFDKFPYFPDDSDNEFELEITDLAPDEEAGVSVALVAEGLRVLSKVRDTSNELVEQGKQRLDGTRDWLMQEEPDKHILEQTPHGEFELRVTSLPPEEIQHTRWTRLYTALGERLAFQKRIWRVGIAIATVILILSIVFATIPNLRAIIANLFARPSQTTTYSSSSTIYLTSSGDGSQGNGLTPTPATTASDRIVITFSGDTGQDAGKYPLSPRPMPTNCPPGPVVNDSHTVGSTPIWISGFSGPRAAIHLPNVPSRSIPQWQGWAVPIVITVPTDYTETVNITGLNLLNGMALSFQLSDSPEITPLLILNPEQPTGLHTIIDGESGISWNVTMYVRASGCYVLNTSWPEGEWNIHFAAGL